MKKFTVSLLTSVAVCLFSVLGVYSVSAEDNDHEAAENEFHGSTVTMEQLQEHANKMGLVGDYKLLSNDENDFLYYDQLDANNQLVYDAMKAYWLKPSDTAVTVTLPEPVSFSANSSITEMWNYTTLNNYYNAIYSVVQGGENAFLYDYPEVFWFDLSSLKFDPVYTSQRSRSLWGARYTITMTKVTMRADVKEVYGDLETAQKYSDYLDECIENYDIEGSDRYSKLKSMYKSIAEAVTYNIEAPYHDTALGMFIEPYQIVCEGYSEAIKLLCDREGIPCISLVGNFDESTNIAHMWNYVKMEDGKWYGLDCTWDDRDGETPSLTYDYFLKGSKSFMKKHDINFGYTYARFVYPELSESDYVYQKPAETAPSVTTAPAVTTDVSQTSVSTATAAPTETTTTEPQQLKGDFNNDGELTIADAVLLQKKLLGMTKVTNYDFMIELNDDGKLNVIDYTILMRLIK